MRRLNPIPVLIRILARFDLALRYMDGLGYSWQVAWAKAAR